MIARPHSAASDALELQGRIDIGLAEDGVKILGGALAADVEGLLANAADHVEVDHGDDFVQRDGRMLDEILRSDQAFLFGGETDEEDGPGRCGCVRSREANSRTVDVPEALSSAP